MRSGMHQHQATRASDGEWSDGRGGTRLRGRNEREDGERGNQRNSQGLLFAREGVCRAAVFSC